MTEWLSYTPQDLLLFSARVYFRLFELHNAALWPAQIATLALGVTLTVLTLRADRKIAGQIMAVALGVLWIWLAWSFLWQRYATINWTAAYLTPLFALQGVLLLWAGIRDRMSYVVICGPAAGAAVALFAAAASAYPLFAPLMHRPLVGAEFFGLMPDPTAIATLAALALAPRRPAGLMVVPSLWLLLSSGILHLLDVGVFWVPGGAALLALILAAAIHRSGVAEVAPPQRPKATSAPGP